jgi:hypothetical protein
MFEQETDAPIDDGWINQKMQADIELFAEKKRSEEEWTAFLKQQIDERTTAELDSLAKEAEITEARKELKGVYADAIGQVAAALASMFKEGSAAQIAALVVEKSAAIAQIIFQTAIANAKAVAASPLTFGQPWVTINTISAGASIAAIAATTISSFKDKKNNNKPGFAEGGYTNGERMYIAGEAGTEWISPNWMTTHPITGPVISNLESLRKNGPTLNPEAIRMFASGGYTNVHQKMNENNSNNYGGDLYGFRGAKMDKMQNEVLTELVNGLKSNTEALKNIKVYASIEDIKKADKNYVDIQNTRGL